MARWRTEPLSTPVKTSPPWLSRLNSSSGRAARDTTIYRRSSNFARDSLHRTRSVDGPSVACAHRDRSDEERDPTVKPKPPVGLGGILTFTLVAVALVFFALRPGSIEVVVGDATPIAPPGDGAAVIGSLLQSGGFSPFGFQITDSTHYVEVQFITQPGCLEMVDSGDPWPTPYTECTSPVEVVGEVGGSGITMSGEFLVGVQIKVPGDCYDLLERGMTWPSDHLECIFET